MKKTTKEIKKVTACLSIDEYRQMLKQMKPGEKVSDFLKSRIFWIKKGK
jgi:hypothetical protein